MSDLFGLGPHAGFILASYAVTVVTCLALVAWVMVDHRRQKATLAELERRGITRRAPRTDGVSS